MTSVLSSGFWVGLLQIIWVDLLLSGDNAVVIALASRALPPKQQSQAIVGGAVAAVSMRVVLTLFAVQLLALPWLKLVGAVLLVWIGAGLLSDGEGDEEVKPAASLWGAIKTILLADMIMSLDNVLAVAAAANAAPSSAKVLLLIIGLGFSIPVVVFGSGIVLRAMERFPIIVVAGAMLLGWIGGEMVVQEPFVAAWLPASGGLHYLPAVLGAVLVYGLGKLRSARKSAAVGARDV